MEVLREVGREGCSTRLVLPVTTAVTKKAQPSTRSYMEVLHKPRQVCARGPVASSGLRGGVTTSAGTQSSEEGGRGAAGLNKEMILRELAEMQSQVEDLQKKIKGLKRCVEEDHGVETKRCVEEDFVKGVKRCVVGVEMGLGQGDGLVGRLDMVKGPTRAWKVKA